MTTFKCSYTLKKAVPKNGGLPPLVYSGRGWQAEIIGVFDNRPAWVMAVNETLTQKAAAGDHLVGDREELDSACKIDRPWWGNVAQVVHQADILGFKLKSQLKEAF